MSKWHAEVNVSLYLAHILSIILPALLANLSHFCHSIFLSLHHVTKWQHFSHCCISLHGRKPTDTLDFVSWPWTGIAEMRSLLSGQHAQCIVKNTPKIVPGWRDEVTKTMLADWLNFFCNKTYNGSVFVTHVKHVIGVTCGK